MSIYDPYKELELYLQQAENEIFKVFEENNKDASHKNTNSSNTISELKNETKMDGGDLGPFLTRFNATIKSDLAELSSRYNNGNIKNTVLNGPYLEINLIENNDTNIDDLNYVSHVPYDCNSMESLINSVASNGISINAATQTSPSISPSSTNLTWGSEYSSSSCGTPNSESDHVEDDTRSISSAELQDSTPRFINLQQILSIKSSSAPVLKKIPVKVNRQTRSQSDRHLAEIEATEACKWLRATGFPQYAQMYEDMQFPIDISTVTQDHPLLEQDVLCSLFRRLQILNNCAHLHQQRHSNTQNTDESEDENCALSNNWTYQSQTRRWSRTCRTLHIPNTEGQPDKSPEPVTENEEPPEWSPVFSERIRRIGSGKLKRRREHVLSNSENRTKLLDSLSQQLNDLKSSVVNHVSDSEITPHHTRRVRTKSFDTSDNLYNPQSTHERILWQNQLPPEQSDCENTRILDSEGSPMANLSCTQLQVLRKLALLKLTAHMEKYCPTHRTGWNWDLQKFIRKIKAPVYRDKSVFGVPLTITVQRIGQSLPKNIEEALLWLQQSAADQEGLFRKSGVKSRIQTLRNMVENSIDILNYNDQQAYDVADMVKQYFRELPEALLTNKLSETFILIFQHVPPYLRRESVLCAILLMPDEHVQVLQVLLYFLLSIAQHSSVNQMNESNLALCFAPSLFHFSSISFKQNMGATHQKELAESRAGHDCLLYFLKNMSNLFKIPQEFVNQCKASEFRESKAVTLNELGKSMGGWREYLNECQMALLREMKEKGRGWVVIPSHHSKVEISFKKVADGHPLRLWKISTEVEAPPSEVVHRIIRQRHIWDPELHSAKIVSQIEKNCEVFQFVRRNITPLPNEEYCIVRSWRTDLPKDACLIVETSIEHQDAIPVPNTVRGIVLASRYLIEPCGSGRSRLLHLSRVDIMGRSPEWYQKNYGHICALFIMNIANSFSQNATGPESKV